MDILGSRLEAFRRVFAAGSNAEEIASVLIPILQFLCLPENNTAENCERVSRFMLVEVLCNEDKCRLLDELPESLSDVIKDIGMILDDTHSSPDIARRFRSTPPELLARLRSAV